MKKLAIISLLFIISISFAQRDSIDFHYMGEFFNTYVYSYCLHEDLVYCQTSIGLEVFELNDELQIQKVDVYEYRDTTKYIKYADGKLYMFPINQRTPNYSVSKNLTVLDVSDLDSIYEYRYYDHFGIYPDFFSITDQSDIIGEDTLACLTLGSRDTTSSTTLYLSINYLQDSPVVEEITNYPIDSLYYASVAYYNNRAYIVDYFAHEGNDIAIIDYTDRAELTETRYTSGNIHNLYNAVNDSVLYVLSTDSIDYFINSYDISDPDIIVPLDEIYMTSHGSIHLYSLTDYPKPEIHFNDSLLFFSYDQLHIINIADPGSMFMVMEYTTIGLSFTLYNNYIIHSPDCEFPGMFGVSHLHPMDMTFYNYSTSDSLVFEEYYPFTLTYYDIFPDGNTFYTGNNSNGLIFGEIIDSNIVDLDFDLPLEWIIDLDVSIENELAAISAYHFGTHIVDFSGSTPVIMSSIDTLSMKSVLNNNNLYVISDTNGIVSYDISDPSTPVYLDNIYSDVRSSVEYEIYDNYLFLTYPTFLPDSIIVIDISDPSDLVQITPSPDSLGIFIKTHTSSDRYIYTEENDTTIGVFLFEDIYRIYEVLTFEVYYPINDLEIQNDYLYVATDEGLYVYDTWGSHEPVLAAFLEGSFGKIAVGDRYLFELYDQIDIYEIEIDPIHELYPGWNLVSYPYSTPSFYPAYEYDTPTSLYSTVSALYSGTGFWILSTIFDDYEFSFTPLSSVTLDIYPGWNLIGGPDADIPADILTSRDEILGPVYDYSRIHSSYETTDTLRNHKGYWILATDSLEITIP